jgi:hypothetical protein
VWRHWYGVRFSMLVVSKAWFQTFARHDFKSRCFPPRPWKTMLEAPAFTPPIGDSNAPTTLARRGTVRRLRSVFG